MKKGVDQHLNKLDFPLPRGVLMCQDEVWVKPSQRFWSGEENENVKKFTKGQTDDRQKAIRKAHLSFQLR